MKRGNLDTEKDTHRKNDVKTQGECHLPAKEGLMLPEARREG